jgi:hypothetical protein
VSARVLLAVVSLVAGVMLAAWSLAAGQLLLGRAGVARIVVLRYQGREAMSKAGKPKTPIKPASDPAWSMKDRPPGDGGAEGTR